MEDWSFLFDIGIPSTFLIVLFALVGLVCLFILLIEKDKARIKRHISATLLIGCVLFVYSSTVIFRPEGPTENIVWIPFKSYYDAFRGQYHLLLENLLNVLLFVPIGILFYLSQKNKSVILPIMISCLMSISIEVCQYIWMKGLCEVDDVIHNTLGCYLGYCLCKFVMNKNTENQ